MFTGKLKRFSIVMCISVLVLLVAACTPFAASETSGSGSDDGVTTLTVTPVDVFKGEGAKFKPFLGAMSGSFKLSYSGTKPYAILEMAIWKNGKKTSSAGSLRDVFFNTDNRDIEVIIAWDPASQDEQHQIKVSLTNSSGSSMYTSSIPLDSKLTAQGLITYTESHTFNVGEPMYVWGLQSTSTNQIHTADFSPESLSRLEWALIFTVRFEDQRPQSAALK